MFDCIAITHTLFKNALGLSGAAVKLFFPKAPARAYPRLAGDYKLSRLICEISDGRSDLALL